MPDLWVRGLCCRRSCPHMACLTQIRLMCDQRSTWRQSTPRQRPSSTGVWAMIDPCFGYRHPICRCGCTPVLLASLCCQQQVTGILWHPWLGPDVHYRDPAFRSPILRKFELWVLICSLLCEPLRGADSEVIVKCIFKAATQFHCPFRSSDQIPIHIQPTRFSTLVNSQPTQNVHQSIFGNFNYIQL